MAKVNSPPALAQPRMLRPYDTDLFRTLFSELLAHAHRLNNAVVTDQEEAGGPIILRSYLKTALPIVANYTGGMIYVTDEAGGAVPAFSDGTNWRRVTDRAIVS